jgi:hypothetical protein
VTTSGTFTFTVVAADIVREMMLNVGAIGEAETPTAQEYNDCLRKLNMLAKQWMGKQDFAPGLKMWTRQRANLFLGYSKYQYQLGPTGDNWAAGVNGGNFNQLANRSQLSSAAVTGATSLQVTAITAMNANDYIGIQYTTATGNSDLFWTTISGAPSGTTVNLLAALPGPAPQGNYVYNYTTKGQRPLDILTSILRDSNQNDTQQNPMTLQDYEMLPSKTQSTYVSDPTAYYYESQIGSSTTGNGQYYIDVGGAQDVTKHLHIVYLRPVMDLNNPGDNPEYPQQWYRALCWGGAKEICGMFDAVWTQDMQESYMEAVAMAREGDSDTTTFYFQVNSGSPYDP